jgi:hypothetical protein
MIQTSWLEGLMAEAMSIATLQVEVIADEQPIYKLTKEQRAEWDKCSGDVSYFVNNYIRIYDAIEGAWIPFTLWPEQESTLETISCNFLTVILKARQLGLTWLCLSYALWLLMFRPIATVLLFSRRDTEAIHLLDGRLKNMYKLLPDWLQVPQYLASDNNHMMEFDTGSTALAFPTSAGDSYTATFALVDEADLVPDLNRLMRAVKPTIDNGGQMVLLSRADKGRPNSEFKNVYRAAKRKENTWAAVFLPWSVHPKRDSDWYEAQRADIESRTGSDDDLKEQYPATDVEALAPRILDKRFNPAWVEAVFDEQNPLKGDQLWPTVPAINGLHVFKLPETGVFYVIGADPAEGNPQSDDSAFSVILLATGEEVATCWGKTEPQVFASYIDQVGQFYNNAPVLTERNNHGHTVIAWLGEHSNLMQLYGEDRKQGWRTTHTSKIKLYDYAANALRDKDALLHNFKTVTQLQSIEASTLSAPEGDYDDCAMAYVLGQQARILTSGQLVSGENPLKGWRG